MLVRQYEHSQKSIFADKNLIYGDKDDATVRKHCRKYSYSASLNSFSMVDNVVNSYHLLLKESLLTLKVKP